MVTGFDALFRPYLTLTLSAFDNIKLVVAVLSDANETYQCVEAKVQSPGSCNAVASSYFVCWNNQWIFCGLTRAYSASISLFTDVEQIDMASIIPVSIPVMTMQQVGFMCVESAHFDHC